jgi:hypothetical protein
MRKIKSSNSGLMLVEDPRETLTALCTFADSEVDWNAFKLSYEKVIGRTEKPIAKGHADTHFYTLTLFKLLLPSEARKSTYRLSLIAKKLCTLLKEPNKKDQYQKILSELLLNNPSKGKLFEEFLKFVMERKSKNEIDKRFNPIPARTLIAWSLEAGLIQKYKDYIQAIHRQKIKFTQAQFWEILTETYNEMQATEVFGIKRIYVPIGELRFNVGVKLGLKTEEFDETLKHLLSTEYGSKITLHGAPTDVFEKNKEETFNYKNKLFVYLSMRV